MSVFTAIIQRDLQLGMRQRTELLTPMIFFLIVVSLFPLGLGLDNEKVMRDVSPAILWIGALLSNMLIMDRLFKSDYDDGSLEQLMLSGSPLVVVVFAKIIAHWCLTAVPLIIVSPILGLMLYFSVPQALETTFLLLIGTPVLSCIGAICTALTLQLKRAGLLLSIIALPLFLPVLIFGVQATLRIVEGHSVIGFYAVFAALDLITLAVAPLITAFALRISLN
ncbi:heme exporter protein CcmB [Wohlfahrtiimonas populi]|jgi:heme exporter protein B|uniref:heme exporter protein CcmB n=1 Tax=Wohlfahrtiimonas populi TaxID=1940240 RepID=UPI00098D182B|nr:heme exporter protein CcmB [Wohlfahrtiimonas populi]